MKAVVVAVVILVLAVVAAPVLVLAPRRSRKRIRAAGGAVVASHFTHGEPTKPAGLRVSEDLCVWLAIQFVTRCDPFMPRVDAEATRTRVAALLAAVAERPDYQGVARVSGRQWRALAAGRLDPHHCYSYRPDPHEPGERFGLLVFLNGHGLNFLFVLEALRPVCDRLRLQLVVPTFGYGNWEAPGGVEAVERATQFGLGAFDADPKRVFLAGLSQGGAGVSRAGCASPDRFAGLVFISPEMELGVIGSPAFATGWRGRPVLVIQGQRDRNVHPRTIDAAVARMEAGGVRVTQHRDPDAGHFLFFAKLDTVTDWVSDWMASILPGRV